MTAAAPSLPVFLAAHVLTGVGVACLLSAGFAGVGAWFPDGEMARAMGFVVGAQSIAWIVGNPIIGVLTDAGLVAARVRGAGGRSAGGARRRAARRRWSGTRIAERPEGPEGIGAVLRDRSARRWALAELVAYSAWTAELTYIGAFYIQTYDVSEATVGFLLAVGSIAFAISTLSTAAITERIARRR